MGSFRWLTAWLVLALAATASGATGDADAAGSQKAPPPIGRLIDIGGYRLHAIIRGTGGPTVVLLAGAGDLSFDWALVQPAAARLTTVCAYDRAGTAWSDPGPVPRTRRQEVYELHLLLQRAHLPPPYVLVGHSAGGMLCQLYAAAYRPEVAGMVLVDSSDADEIDYIGRFVNGQIVAGLVRLRETATGKPIPPVQTLRSSPPKPPSAEVRRQMEASLKMTMPTGIEAPYDRLPPHLQRLDLWFRQHPKLSFPDAVYSAEELQQFYLASQKTPHPLGEMPLISLRAGTHSKPDASALRKINMTPDDWERYQEDRAADLAGLSNSSRWYVARDSGHAIQLEDPELVVFAIQRVVEAVRRHQRL